MIANDPLLCLQNQVYNRICMYNKAIVFSSESLDINFQTNTILVWLYLPQSHICSDFSFIILKMGEETIIVTQKRALWEA